MTNGGSPDNVFYEPLGRMNRLKAFIQNILKRRGLLLVITAAILIEMVSGAQYFYTHRLLEEQLEERAESELTMKAILIKSTMSSAEDILLNHIWDTGRALANTDSMMETMERIVSSNQHVQSAFMAYVPNYIPSRERLLEPFAEKSGDNIVKGILSGDSGHDYTQSQFYTMAIDADGPVWSDPYINNGDDPSLVTSCAMSIRDLRGDTAGVVGIDMSLKWLSDTINSRHVYHSSFNILLTEQGTTIARPPESRASSETTDHLVMLINQGDSICEKSHSGLSKKVSFSDNGRKGTVFYANMRGKPHWQIAVVCYDDEVYKSLRNMRLSMLGLMLVAFAILLFMVRRFAREEHMLVNKNMEEQRIGNELRIASNIQQAMIDMNEETFSSTDYLKVWGTLIPAKAVGGDLFHAFVRDDKLFFCIGDVSGKGIPSALIMAVMQSLFRNIASHENDPAHIMAQLNETACRNNKSNIFVTLFVGVLDLPSGHLRFCNAGHERPVVVRKKPTDGDDGQTMECLTPNVKPNLPIGLFDDFHYEKQEAMLNGGETLFLYTDGLTEGRNSNNEQFGRQRVLDVLAHSTTLEPKALVKTMTEAISKFEGDADRRDDLTILAVNYSPTTELLMLDEQLTLENDIKHVRELNAFVKSACERSGIDKPLTNKLRLAMEEAVVNVMQYAYPAGTNGNVHVRITSNGRRMKFIITDSGIAFNPTEASKADTTLSAEERPVGGLGILLVRKLMDSINYERLNGKNVLTLRKDFAPAEK